jgi:hypothetical protein
MAFIASSARRADADDPVADALYREGRLAAQAKNWDLACSKFRQSQEREPAPGTALNLGDCEENRGHWVAAADHFREAVRYFKPGDGRVEYSEHRLAALEKKIPRLFLRLHASAASGVTVQLDGASLDAESLRTPKRVDPGDHTVVVRAPGRTEQRSIMRLAPAESREVDLTVGSPLSEEPADAAPGPTVPTVRTEADAPVPAAPAHAPNRIPAYAAFGFAGAAFTLGAVSGVIALTAGSTVREQCSNHLCATQEGVDAAARAGKWAAVSTVSFIAAGASAGLGAYLLAKAHVAPSVGQGYGGVLVRGAF